jgi:predicted Zn-dependent protease
MPIQEHRGFRGSGMINRPAFDPSGAQAGTQAHSSLRRAFGDLAHALQTASRPDEFACAWVQAEASEYVRLNQGRIRQAGSVHRLQATVRLIQGARQASHAITLSDDPGRSTAEQVLSALQALREVLSDSEDDPLLDVCRDPVVSEDVGTSGAASHDALADSPTRLDALIDALSVRDAQGDLVAFIAGGRLGRGFCSSTGASQWFERHSIAVDGSIHLPVDPVTGDRRAVKFGWSGETADPDALSAAVAQARVEARLLQRPARRLSPGDYRVLLRPRALADLLGMLDWGGYSARAHLSGQSPLARLRAGQQTFSPLLDITEDLSAGLSPAFQTDGYSRTPRTDLIRSGRFADWMVSPATAKEFGIPGNAAQPAEVPESVVVGCGQLPDDASLARLGTGVLLSNLWYLNFSDREACRITGMTRFACLWVEDGEPVAPIEAMRFDDSLYRVLGEPGLEALGDRAHRMPNLDTWEGRATGGILAPSALVGALRFAL